jgi:outer membrane lipoprotein SlyB
MRILITLLACLPAGALLQADTLYLRDGRTLEGTFLSGTSGQIRFLSRGNSQSFAVSSVERVSFGSAAGSSARYGTDGSRARGARATVPSGTVVSVRTVDPINSDKSNVGDSYRATLEDPIVVDGRTIAPKGADVTLRVARVEQAGLTGTEDVSLELAQIKTADGRTYDVRSTDAKVSAKNRNSDNIKIIGGTAVLGAIIGAIAGGGKGAAIGAAAGAGAGAAVQAVRGQRVEIAPESVLDFTIAEPLNID